MTAKRKPATKAKAVQGRGNTETLATKFMDQESAIMDMVHMANIVSTIIEDAIGDDSHEAITKSPDFYFLPEDQTEKMLFSVYHLERMIKKFKDDWFKSLHEEAVDVPPTARAPLKLVGSGKGTA
jgi:hypothetical protein